MHSVLFVCTANICRSPMAEGLFRWLVKSEISEWEIDSAGTWTIDGQAISEGTLRSLQKKGIQINNHKSKQVNQDLLNSYQLILTMEQGQKEALCIEFPEIVNRVFMISEMIEQKFDIVDPIGRKQIDFDETANELQKILEDGFYRIEQLSMR